MKIYLSPDGTTLEPGQPFQLPNGSKFPADWLEQASPQDFVSNGITMTVEPDAPPPPAAPPTVTAEQFLQLFTTAERQAIEASTDPITKDIIVQLEAGGSFQINAPQITQGVGYLVTQNLLTSTRAAQILAATPPPTS